MPKHFTQNFYSPVILVCVSDKFGQSLSLIQVPLLALANPILQEHIFGEQGHPSTTGQQ